MKRLARSAAAAEVHAPPAGGALHASRHTAQEDTGREESMNVGIQKGAVAEEAGRPGRRER